MENTKPKLGDEVVIDGKRFRYVNDTDLIRYYAEGMMALHRLYEYRFIWDNAVGRFGQHRGRSKVISLSLPLAKITPLKDICDTILHEIAHALDYKERGFTNHDSHWSQIAKSIGSNGMRCSKKINEDLIKYKYTYACSDCGYKWKYHRRMSNATGRFHIKCRRIGKQGKIIKVEGV